MIAALLTGVVAWICSGLIAYRRGHEDGAKAALQRVDATLEFCSDQTAREMRAALELEQMERPR